MKKFFKRASVLILGLAMLTNLVACDGSNDNSATTGRYEITSLSAMIQGVNDMAMVDEIAYILAYDNVDNIGIYKLETDTKNLELIYSSIGVVSIAHNRQGGLWALDAEYDESTAEVSFFLTHLHTDGTVIDTRELDIDLSIDNYTTMVSDGDGNLYINDNGKIYLIDADGSYVGETTVSEFALGLAVSAKGQVMSYDDEKAAFCTVDWSTKAYANIYSFDAPLKGLMDGDDAYDIYYYDMDGIYGYNLNDETADKVLLWQENDIAQVWFCGMIDSENYLIYDTSIILLSYTEEPLVERATLTLASMEPSQMISDAIALYNRSNNQYQVEIIDYSEYNTENDMSAGLIKLNTEIIAGDGPDLIDLTGLPIQQYAQKGLLMELGLLFDKDEGISRSDYLTNILSALEVDGKLYSITPAFRISTVLGRTSQVGQDTGWTYKAFQSLVNETGRVAFANMTRDEVLEMLFEANKDLFVDLEAGICDFTSGSFTQLLAIAEEYPEKVKTIGYTSSVIQLERGDALLAPLTLYDDIDYMLYESILGGDITFIGYPTPDGTGGSGIVPLGEYGILSDSSNPDGAWEFLCYLLSQNVQEGFYNNYPIMENSLNTMLEGYMDLGAASGTIGTDIDGEDVEVEIYALSEEAVNKYRLLIESLDTVKRDNADLVDIILEEAGSYFNGDRDGDETAAIIQNRISNYLSEQS